MDINPEYLRDAAVEIVKAYLIQKKPLTEGVTDLALRDNLNGEQIRRIVETVNQVAYLKLLESAEDRTFEFPLASYEDVMAKILSPQEIVEHDSSPSPLSLMKQAMEEPLDKEASDHGLESVPEGVRLNMLYQEYNRTERALEKIAVEERAMFERLMSHVEKCRGDDELIDKVAFITDGNEITCKKVSKLVFGQVKQASGNDLFYEEDLVNAEKMVDLLKQAEELVERKVGLEKSASEAKAFLTHKAKKLAGNAKGVLASAKPTRLDLGIGALTYRPSNNIWTNLHRKPE